MYTIERSLLLSCLFVASACAPTEGASESSEGIRARSQRERGDAVGATAVTWTQRTEEGAISLVASGDGGEVIRIIRVSREGDGLRFEVDGEALTAGSRGIDSGSAEAQSVVGAALSELRADLEDALVEAGATDPEEEFDLVLGAFGGLASTTRADARMSPEELARIADLRALCHHKRIVVSGIVFAALGLAAIAVGPVAVAAGASAAVINVVIPVAAFSSAFALLMHRQRAYNTCGQIGAETHTNDF